MKTKRKVNYLMVIDQSGSMEPLKDGLVKNYHEQLEAIQSLSKQKGLDVYVTTVLFNESVSFVQINKGLEDLWDISYYYKPDGLTAMNDALGISLNNILLHSAIDQINYVSVFTDGLENASTIYSAEDISKLYQQIKEGDGKLKIFCPKGDAETYRVEMDFAEEDICGIEINESGLAEMSDEICYDFRSF